MNTIGSLMKDRDNNYDFIRLLASITVIFSHSFPLSLGKFNGNDPDPLYQLTGDISFGRIAVIVFFIISGFLITQSYLRHNDPSNYLKARILRIFPGLIFIVLFTVFILGPIVTTLSLNEYFSNGATYEYIKVLSLIFISYPLPGVFENNIYPSLVNGSIWTLFFEFICYIGIMILGYLGFLRKGIILFIYITSSFLAAKNFGGDGFYGNVINILSFFSVGMLFYAFKEKIKLTPRISFIAFIILLVSLVFYKFYFLPIITTCLAYIIMYLTYATKRKINGSKYGDFSYGTYIFAFPIQQSVTYFFGGTMYWWANFLISFPIIFLMSICSWHWVEKNALKLKKQPLVKKEVNKIVA
ncbi:acyltransferase [Neobacillus sp. 114]|uniref:acyltransferase family protein n=1 Tax=Neobacillus sp. 114 TaxID=3048535 RepID=UPI0024C321D0|nr:acyltransferase [Neobacillus sp. 114]